MKDIISLKEILQDLPPGKYFNVQDAVYESSPGWEEKPYMFINTPELQMFCDNEKCSGVRLFEHNECQWLGGQTMIEIGNTSFDHVYIEYLCQNCKENIKSYAILLDIYHDKKTANIIKLGEFPFYGPHLPSKLIALIGPDRELFLKGIRCESQNLGIAAFSYYRRVIENQRNRLIDKVIEVLMKIESDKKAIELLNTAKTETQFTSSMKKLKPYLPDGLLIDGTNPLSLLHKTLSIGIHNLSDKDCLEYANSIRVILTELADRLKILTSNKSELKNALGRLNKLNSGN